MRIRLFRNRVSEWRRLERRRREFFAALIAEQDKRGGDGDRI